MEPHPIRLVQEKDDLRRSRLTVGFRLILAIPHLIWITLWGIAIFFAAIIGWFAALVLGRLPESLHRFSAAYVRYSTHLNAYLFIAANPYPGFVGEQGEYPVDATIEPPARLSRLKVAFRFFLALPALLLMTALAGAGAGGTGPGGQYSGTGGTEEEVNWASELGWSFSGAFSAVAMAAFLGWFVCVATGRMPLGFRDLAAWGLRYSAQTWGYLLLLTDRYPNSDPRIPPATIPTPEKPVRLAVEDDLRRSRLTVFFRFLLTLPHLIWLSLWSIAVFFALIVGWFAALFTGRLPGALHRFIAAFVRYETHVLAFLFLVANPFPGFTGTAGTYTVDLVIPGPERQNRWRTLFRMFLAIPAYLLGWWLFSVLWVASVLLWWVGLILGRAPVGLRNTGAYCLRYLGQTYAYAYLLTDSYPFAGPNEYVAPAIEPDFEPAWPGPLRFSPLSS